MVCAQSTKESNIFKYAGTKDCQRYIPLYGRPSNTLVLKIYPAQEYMGSWMKSSEYPNKTYVATYDGNGLLAIVECESEDEKSVYTYSYGELYKITRYSKSTGSQRSSEYPDGPSYGKRGEKRITDNNKYFTVWFNTEKYDGGLMIRFSACAYEDKKIYIIHKNSDYYYNSIDLRKNCGLSWISHTGESDPYNPISKMLTKNNDLSRGAEQFYSSGIPTKGIKNNADVVSYNNHLIIGNNYYEYIWSY